MEFRKYRRFLWWAIIPVFILLIISSMASGGSTASAPANTGASYTSVPHANPAPPNGRGGGNPTTATSDGAVIHDIEGNTTQAAYQVTAAEASSRQEFLAAVFGVMILAGVMYCYFVRGGQPFYLKTHWETY